MRSFSNRISESLSRGRLVFTKQFALENSWAPTERALLVAAQRAVARGELFHPRRGTFVIVPYQYRADGYVPAEFVLDCLMKIEEARYYVGLHKAAIAYGVESRVGAGITVVANKRLPKIALGRSAVSFVYMKAMPSPELIERKALHQHELEVARPSLTAVDLLRYSSSPGDTASTWQMIFELAGQIQPDELVALTSCVKGPVLQRLGFVLDRVGQFELSDELHRLIGNGLRVVNLTTAVEREDTTAMFDRHWKVLFRRSDVPFLD